MNYYISDQHFYTEQFVRWRGFQTVSEMNDAMIEKWNGKVSKDDYVYILGDFSQGNGSETNELLKHMNGIKILLRGNHDDFLEDAAFNRNYFIRITDYLEIRDGGYDLVLSHYPIPCYNGQYREATDPERKTFMLYGHVHNSYDEVLLNEYIMRTRRSSRKLEGADSERPIPCNMINCFCRFCDYVPLSLTEWIIADSKRRENFKHTDYF